MNRKWYAVYTHPRWEKKVHRLLTQRGMESYCPLNKVRRQWSDRVRLVEVPLFTSYVFVKADEKDFPAVRTTPGILNFVYWNGKPAVIKDAEIAAIRKFLDDYEEVAAVPLEVKPGDEVSVAAGPLMNRRGRVLEVNRKTVKIAIVSLGYELVAYVDKARLHS